MHKFACTAADFMLIERVLNGIEKFDDKSIKAFNRETNPVISIKDHFHWYTSIYMQSNAMK